ncbi:hypothetical protein ACFXNW_13980 [Nocardia sp. NPDC059180]|uniref:hypothetical protein n=1 Tax=Nocardia sp. NPDC059180 TaxID=3346761 RepID=UPI0036C573C1
MPTKPAIGAAVLAGIVALSGPVAYTVDTLNSAHTGPIPTAGPETGGMGGPVGMRFGDGGRPGMPPGAGGGAVTPGSDGTSDGSGSTGRGKAGQPSDDGAPAGQLSPDGAPTDQPPTDDASTGQLPPDGTQNGQPPTDGASTGQLPTTGATAGQPSGRDGSGGMGGGPGGGVMGSSEPGDELVALLEQDGATYTWAAATVSSNSAAGYQLATELPVMPIGGFNGSDPSPTLEQFQQYVAEGQIHYFLGGNRGGPSSEDSESSRITAWAQTVFTATEVDGVTVYDLTAHS